MRTILIFCLLVSSLSFAQETNHTTMLESGPVAYTATVGSVPTHNPQGEEIGQIFYTAYRRQGVENTAERPITFAFNGGPGSCSIWLHLGALGPKRVVSLEEGQSIAPPYRWIDNADSILDISDLVFIDPMGCGFSQIEPGRNADAFYGVEGDITAIGDFICDYLTKENRWKSPKYIAGESYGTLRACGLARYLGARHNLYLNGLILISCAIDYRTLLFGLDNELPYSLYLPTYAATAWIHGRLDPALSLEETVEKARAFALEYGTALFKKGAVPTSLYGDLAAWTGLSPYAIERFDGLIDENTFALHFFGTEKKVLGLSDTRYTGDSLPGYSYEDPSWSKIAGLFTGAFHAYLFEELEWKSSWPRYELFASEGHAKWDFGTLGYPNTMDRLRKALAANPELRIFTACGYFDLATPFAAAEHCFKRLHLPREENVTFGYYEGGHLFYINPSALKKFKGDLVKFYAGKQ